MQRGIEELIMNSVVLNYLNLQINDTFLPLIDVYIH